MSEWKKVKFLDVVSLNPRISLEKGVEYPFVEMSNAVPGARKPEKDVYQKYSGGGAKFEEGDTVVARIEPCLQNGKGFQCPYKKGFGSTEFLVFRPMNLREMDYNFLYYYMGQQSIREAMAKTMVGASGRQRVNNSVFNDLLINLSPLNIQQEIATILSRYDSLIENYQKQIKLLEETEQRLYKEWFVDLRFPGHENTKIVNGLPEGWEKKKVGELISKTNRTKQIPSNCYQTQGSIPIIDQSRNYIAGYTDDWESLINVTIPYIVFGDHTRILKYIPFSFAKGADGTQLIMSNDLYRMPQTLFYNSLVNIDLSNYSYARHFKYLKEEYILVPPREIAISYDGVVTRNYHKILNNREQIRLLTEARNRLLPKLMSGEMKV